MTRLFNAWTFSKTTRGKKNVNNNNNKDAVNEFFRYFHHQQRSEEECSTFYIQFEINHL
jgi:hypothetical protein